MSKKSRGVWDEIMAGPLSQRVLYPGQPNRGQEIGLKLKLFTFHPRSLIRASGSKPQSLFELGYGYTLQRQGILCIDFA